MLKPLLCPFSRHVPGLFSDLFASFISSFLLVLSRYAYDIHVCSFTSPLLLFRCNSNPFLYPLSCCNSNPFLHPLSRCKSNYVPVAANNCAAAVTHFRLIHSLPGRTRRFRIRSVIIYVFPLLCSIRSANTPYRSEK